MAESERTRAVEVEDFQYPDSGKPDRGFWDSLPEVGCRVETSPCELSTTSSTGKTPRSFSTSHSSNASAGALEDSFRKGRALGIREGRAETEAARISSLKEIETRHIVQSADLVNRFAQERDRFFELAEQDVVRLSLAIAERILRREAQMDPLLLVGAVRVALGQLSQSMHVRLRVPSAEADLWTQTMAHIPNLKVRPEVVADPAMEAGGCTIESEIGSADLGLSAQLHTIQHALLDGQPDGERDRKPGHAEQIEKRSL